MPKSATFTCPSARSARSQGLTSRWTIPLRWAKPSAAAISVAMSAARLGCSGLQSLRITARTALDVLHDDEVRPVLLAPVVDPDHVLVVEVGGRLGLPTESPDERWVCANSGNIASTATGRSRAGLGPRKTSAMPPRPSGCTTRSGRCTPGCRWTSGRRPSLGRRRVALNPTSGACASRSPAPREASDSAYRAGLNRAASRTAAANGRHPSTGDLS